MGQLIILLGNLFARWFANQPEHGSVVSADEMNAELERVFVKRESITCTVPVEYLPVLLDRLHLAVDSGFESHQVDTLLARVENHRVYQTRHAIYPVDVSHQASDVELMWFRDDSGHVKLTVIAVPPVLNPVKTVLRTLPAKVCAGPLRWSATILSI